MRGNFTSRKNGIVGAAASIRASVMTCASLAVLVCAGAVVSPAVAQKNNRDRDYDQRQQIASWQGFYIGGNVGLNFNTLGQTETFTAARVVTNRFEDSSNGVDVGLVTGYYFAPSSNKNLLVGPYVSAEFFYGDTGDTSHTFPPGPSFLGQTINTIVTVGGQVGFVPRPDVLVYGQVGAAFVKLTQKLNFSGPVTSVDQTVTGANLGVGVAFQPANWQIAGHPVALVAQYNHIILPVATSNNPGSPGFIYDNRNNINKLIAGFRVQFDTSVSNSFRWYN